MRREIALDIGMMKVEVIFRREAQLVIVSFQQGDDLDEMKRTPMGGA